VYDRRPSSGVAVAVFVPLAPLGFPVRHLSYLVATSFFAIVQRDL
jgi:hypothetical protein